MLSIWRIFTFDAAHRLEAFGEGHKCATLHGHTYRVILAFSGRPDKDGILVPFEKIDSAWEPVKMQLDHKVLNEVMPCPPTVENIAQFIFDEIEAEGLPIVCADVSEGVRAGARVGMFSDGGILQND